MSGQTIRAGSRHERRRRAERRKATEASAPPAPAREFTQADYDAALVKLRRVIVCVCDIPDNTVHECVKEPKP